MITATGSGGRMSSSRPLTIGLLFGGASGEHAVSIRSARTVLSGLQDPENRRRYRVLPIYIDREGRWWPPDVADRVLTTGSAEGTSAQSAGKNLAPGFHGLPAAAEGVEAWFLVLHGPNGEDGTVQGLFTLMGTPFVGSGVLGSAVGMDKQAMKAAFAAAGLPQVAYLCCGRERVLHDSQALVHELEKALSYPCFVKPANLGSSVGISRCSNREELRAGLMEACSHDARLVVEQGVTARELECAALGVEHLQASVVGEICFEADWYDYNSKYSEGLSHCVIPARIPAPTAERIQQLTIASCRAVAARGLARVDFFYDETAERLWVNEINTLPGFTSQSMYPLLWQASGLSLATLVHHLIALALGDSEPSAPGKNG